MGFLARTFYEDGFEVFSLDYPGGEKVELRLVGLEGPTPVVRWRHSNGELRMYRIVNGGPLPLPKVAGIEGRLAGEKYSAGAARIAVDVPAAVNIRAVDYRDLAAADQCSDCGGLGWFIAEADRKFWILRCDSCAVFVDDHKAGLAALDSLSRLIRGHHG